jgi:phage-related protein
MKKIIFYKNSRGDSPVEKFLNTLTDKQAKKVAWVLRIIRDLDFVPNEYFKKLVATNLWEIRIQTGNDALRILGFIHDYNFIVLTNGFRKKTQKTPQKEIKLAEQRMKEYLSRSKGNG